MSDDLYDTTLSLTLPLVGGVWRPPSGPRHRAPRGYRKALTVALVTVALAALVMVAFLLNVLTWYHGVNAGFTVQPPFHLLPQVSAGFEYRGIVGFFYPPTAQ